MWQQVWQELRDALLLQPRCPDHPEYPCVRTLRQGIVNDIIRVGPDGVLVRSHQTNRDDFIEADRFRVWWDHLQRFGTASLAPNDQNNPNPWRARIVGAILAGCLPARVRWDRERPGELRLVANEGMQVGDIPGVAFIRGDRVMPKVSDRYRGTTEYVLVLAELVRAAQYRGLTTYQDLAVVLGLPTRGEHLVSDIGHLLGEISEDEVARGRPMLSAVVVGSTSRPGSGFFHLARALGRFNGPADQADNWR
jgi:hypothetical protein